MTPRGGGDVSKKNPPPPARREFLKFQAAPRPILKTGERVSVKKSSLLLTALLTLTCGAAFAAEPALNIGAALKSGETVGGAPVIRAESVEQGMKLVADESKEGVFPITSPSGKAVGAVGTASYTAYENIDASLLSQRYAYVRAYLAAQKKLAEYLNGLNAESTTIASDGSDDGATGKKTLTNESSQVAEDIRLMLSEHLDNFIVREVRDLPGGDGASGTVSVTLAVSPNVGKACRAVSSGFIDAASIQEGVDYVMNELSHGVLPPAGGKVMRVPQTGEVAVISVGSEIVIDRRDAERSKQVARRRADARANAAMVEILQGSDIAWNYGLSSEMKELNEEFERVSSEDAFGNRREKIVELQEVRKTFSSKMKDSEDYRSVAKGTVPPGVQSKFFFSEDGRWCFCVKMYTPSLTLQAQELREALRNPEPEQGSVSVPIAPAAPRAPQMPGRGPSGKVQDDSLL